MTTPETRESFRVSEAVKSLEEQLRELRSDLSERRVRLEKDVRKRAEQAQERVRTSSLYRRAEQVRRDWEGQVDKARTSLYEMVGIATKSDIDKLNKKLNALSRRLSEFARDGAGEPPEV